MPIANMKRDLTNGSPNSNHLQMPCLQVPLQRGSGSCKTDGLGVVHLPIASNGASWCDGLVLIPSEGIHETAPATLGHLLSYSLIIGLSSRVHPVAGRLRHTGFLQVILVLDLGWISSIRHDSSQEYLRKSTQYPFLLSRLRL